MEEFHTRRAPSGAVLADEVSGVLSEMGRHPARLHRWQDHGHTGNVTGGVDGGQPMEGSRT